MRLEDAVGSEVLSIEMNKDHKHVVDNESCPRRLKLDLQAIWCATSLVDVLQVHLVAQSSFVWSSPDKKLGHIYDNDA